MHRILFVHSDEKLTALYKPRLSNYFFVDSARNGLSAVRKIRLHKPRLIISDYELPLLSGLALLRFVRSHPNLFAIPFVFLTDSLNVQDALSSGANDYLFKKFANPDAVVEKIYHHLSRTTFMN